MGVGLELRQARERRGVSLQEIANSTKISLRVLQAIESDDEARLPAKVFTRSFVKTYAAQVGLEPDATMRRYLEQLEPPDTPETIGGVQGPPVNTVQKEAPLSSPGRVLQGRFGTAAVLLLAGITAVTLALTNSRDVRSNEGRPTARVVSTAGVGGAGVPQPAAVGTSGTSPATAPADGLHLAIAPTARCWVRAVAADRLVFAALLEPGDRRTVDAASDVTLRVGDPAAFAFSINGKPARIAGRPRQPMTVHVTTDNFARFLIPSS
jgi:cytoskeleton protein RodZ